VGDVTLRFATNADVDRIIEILNAVPGEEAVAFMGSAERALRYDDMMFRLDPIPNESRKTMLAEADGEVLGVFQYQFGDAPHHSRVDVLKVMLKVMGPFRLARKLPAIYSRTKIDIDIPTDSLFITNVHVDEAARGRDVGTTLLDWGLNEAVRLGARDMSVTTLPTNTDAIRFYEKFGFEITQTVTDPSYEKHTKIPGRVYLVKELPKPDVSRPRDGSQPTEES
jgi:ribosomal protein S18 acetylase RimI-like enzyme